MLVACRLMLQKSCVHRLDHGKKKKSKNFENRNAKAQIFNILEQLQGAEASNSTRSLGFFLDAQNAAFADRNQCRSCFWQPFCQRAFREIQVGFSLPKGVDEFV